MLMSAIKSSSCRLQNSTQLYNAQSRGLCSKVSFRSLSEQLVKITSAASQVNIPRDWNYKVAHHGNYTPSVGMLVWRLTGNRKIADKHDRHDLLSDKKILIEELSVLHENGDVSFSDDVCLIARGVTQGTICLT